MRFFFEGSRSKRSRLSPFYNLLDINEKEVVDISGHTFQDFVSEVVLVKDNHYTLLCPSGSCFDLEEFLEILNEKKFTENKFIFFIKNESLIRFLSMSLFPRTCFVYLSGKITLLDSKKNLVSRYHQSLKSRKSQNVAVILDKIDEDVSHHIMLIKSTCTNFSKNLFLLSLGIISEQKLANFPLIDLFVTPSLEVPSKIASSLSPINTFEFISGCFDMFFSTNYGNLQFYSKLILENTADHRNIYDINDLFVDNASFYGLVNCDSFKREILPGNSGWSRNYNHELP